jgi:hypothetical protein
MRWTYIGCALGQEGPVLTRSKPQLPQNTNRNCGFGLSQRRASVVYRPCRCGGCGAGRLPVRSAGANRLVWGWGFCF